MRYPRAIAVKILVFHLADNRAAWYLEREILWCFFKRSSYAACHADKENRRIGSQQLIVDISIKRVIVLAAIIVFSVFILSMAATYLKILQF